MQLAYPPTYLSRVISLPAAVAADALDRVRGAGALDPSVRTDPSEWLSIPAAAGTLELAREDAPDHPARILPVRQVPGRLRTRLPWPTVAVELELTSWSTGRTEVGLRYQSAPGRRGLRLYHTIGGEALGRLGRALEVRRPPAVAVASRRRPRVA